jgi:hypothetical protein
MKAADLTSLASLTFHPVVVPNWSGGGCFVGAGRMLRVKSS